MPNLPPPHQPETYVPNPQRRSEGQSAQLSSHYSLPSARIPSQVDANTNMAHHQAQRYLSPNSITQQTGSENFLRSPRDRTTQLPVLYEPAARSQIHGPGLLTRFPVPQYTPSIQPRLGDISGYMQLHSNQGGPRSYTTPTQSHSQYSDNTGVQSHTPGFSESHDMSHGPVGVTPSPRAQSTMQASPGRSFTGSNLLRSASPHEQILAQYYGSSTPGQSQCLRINGDQTRFPASSNINSNSAPGQLRVVQRYDVVHNGNGPQQHMAHASNSLLQNGYQQYTRPGLSVSAPQHAHYTTFTSGPVNTRRGQNAVFHSITHRQAVQHVPSQSPSLGRLTSKSVQEANTAYSRGNYPYLNVASISNPAAGASNSPSPPSRLLRDDQVIKSTTPHSFPIDSNTQEVRKADRRPRYCQDVPIAKVGNGVHATGATRSAVGAHKTGHSASPDHMKSMPQAATIDRLPISLGHDLARRRLEVCKKTTPTPLSVLGRRARDNDNIDNRGVYLDDLTPSKLRFCLRTHDYYDEYIDVSSGQLVGRLKRSIANVWRSFPVDRATTFNAKVGRRVKAPLSGKQKRVVLDTGLQARLSTLKQFTA